MAHDDLDAVFASPGSSFPTATSHMSNASPDPFDLFGGLGTTSTGNVKEADQPVKGDMLGETGKDRIPSPQHPYAIQGSLR